MSAETAVQPPARSRRVDSDRLLAATRDFFVNVLGQVRILKKVYPGVMHFLLFWGVSIQVIGTAINLMQMKLFTPFALETFPRTGWYLAYELTMDLAGVAILLGVLLAAFRRGVLRPKTLETRWDDTLALIVLTLIPLAGFTTEGLRLTAASPAWAAWSPVGNLVAGWMRALGLSAQAAAAAHPYLVWTHIFLGVTLVALIPFTKLRHLIFAPLNILVRTRRPQGALSLITDLDTAEVLGAGKVTEFTAQQLLSFDACLRCGRCEEACPANFSGMDYSPRILVQSLRRAMIDSLAHGEASPDRELLGAVMDEQYPWHCTTCGACLSRCPAFVNPVDEVVDLRRYQVMTTGKMPKSVGDTLRNLERQGNPWGMPPESRLAWAEGLNVRTLAPGDQTDVLLFVGCAAAFDERNKQVARAFARILQRAGVDFAVLGLDEVCCGETARRMGHEYMFQEMAKQNIATLAQVRFNRVVTACPHCFNTLRNEYPQLGADLPVQHYSQYLAELGLPAGSANGDGIHATVTFHDSCYLGRYNQVYAAPRELLRHAGLQPVEMARSGEDSFCCGGGGGQMWMETDANARINHRRLQDALDAGAEVVATACPYCLLMFDDAIRSKGLGEQVRVMDLAEVLAAQSKS